MAHCDRLLRTLGFCSSLLVFAASLASAQVAVPEAPPKNSKVLEFRDGHYGVQFRVPLGWTVNRKDGEVSTFHLDARSASPHTQMRGVLAIQFNPYPYSTFSGARFYYSVERHSTDAECAAQATGPVLGHTSLDAPHLDTQHVDTQDIAGMNFVHGHDEHGNVCVEARDEVYTAFRKGSCYRFDLAMDTFCGVSSGMQDLTDTQVEQIDRRMTDILSTVKLDWSKSGPHPVPVPRVPPPQPAAPGNRMPLPEIQSGEL